MNLFKRVGKFFQKIGPGFITGAADDDPSGIATYSIAGAQFGYRLSWLSVFLVPAMVAIQEMCGRIGMVTGNGLAGVVGKYRSKGLMWFVVSLLCFANIINIGADLGIIAASIQMLVGLPFYFWLAIVALFIVLMEVFVSYKRYSEFLKYLALTLMVYVVTALIVKQDWREVLSSTLIPNIEFNNLEYLMMMVGFLGTTISPYLFFWQASEEIEEEIVHEKIKDFNNKPKVSGKAIKAMVLDTKVGMVFSNLMTFFIILTTAATLNANGITNIETPQQAASALKPLAGDWAYFLFALGIVGIGLQSIPVLAGSIAYAVSDALNLKEGLTKKFSQAKGFYIVIVLATLAGFVINLLGINTMKALFYAAIVNGIVAVPLIFIIIGIASDKKIMGEYQEKNGRKVIAWITFVFMVMAVGLMGWSLIKG